MLLYEILQLDEEIIAEIAAAAYSEACAEEISAELCEAFVEEVAAVEGQEIADAPTMLRTSRTSSMLSRA